MKKHRAVLAIAFGLACGSAYAGNERFCRKAADDFTDWVVRSRAKLGDRETVQALQRQYMSNAVDYRNIVERVGNRAMYLLDTSLTTNQVRADLFSLCMTNT